MRLADVSLGSRFRLLGTGDANNKGRNAAETGLELAAD